MDREEAILNAWFIKCDKVAELLDELTSDMTARNFMRQAAHRRYHGDKEDYGNDDDRSSPFPHELKVNIQRFHLEMRRAGRRNKPQGSNIEL